MKIKRLGLASLFAGVVLATTSLTPAFANNYGNGNTNSGQGAAAQATAQAIALAQKANACIAAKGVAACSAEIAAANAARAHALALAAQAGLPAPKIPVTGFGGTAPFAGKSGVVTGTTNSANNGLYSASNSRSSSNAGSPAASSSQAVSSLPATGGAADASGTGSNPLLPIGASLGLLLAGFGIRRTRKS